MTDNILKDLYFGNYQITDEVAKDDYYNKQLNLLVKLEDYIRKNQNKKTNDLLDDYRRISDRIHNIETITAYEQGFRLAQKLLLK